MIIAVYLAAGSELQSKLYYGIFTKRTAGLVYHWVCFTHT